MNKFERHIATIPVLSDKMEKHYLVIHIKNRFEIYSESLINLYNFQNLIMVWIHSGMRR